MEWYHFLDLCEKVSGTFDKACKMDMPLLARCLSKDCENEAGQWFLSESRLEG